MNKKRVDRCIPHAINAIIEEGICKDNKIPKEFKGYVSSFGASIVQTGLLATIAFYANTNANTKEQRDLVPAAIYSILIKDGLDTSKGNYKNLFEYVADNNTKIVKDKICDAMISLKLALRSFERAS